MPGLSFSFQLQRKPLPGQKGSVPSRKFYRLPLSCTPAHARNAVCFVFEIETSAMQNPNMTKSRHLGAAAGAVVARQSRFSQNALGQRSTLRQNGQTGPARRRKQSRKPRVNNFAAAPGAQLQLAKLKGSQELGTRTTSSRRRLGEPIRGISANITRRRNACPKNTASHRTSRPPRKPRCRTPRHGARRRPTTAQQNAGFKAPAITTAAFSLRTGSQCIRRRRRRPRPARVDQTSMRA